MSDQPKKQMSRGKQTAWIVTAIVAVGFMIANSQPAAQSDDPYSQCEGLFVDKRQCETFIAMEHVDGRSGWGYSSDAYDRAMGR